MRIDPVLTHMQQQARKPPLLLYVQNHEAKANAKANFMKGLADKDPNAYLSFAIAYSEARMASAKQFLTASVSYYDWHKGSLAEMGTILIGNMLDCYA